MPYDKEILTGPIAQVLAERAATLGCDTIVMGTHGRGGFQQLVLGSITEKVLRRATCPVLTVPPGADAAPSVPGPFTSILCATDFSNASLAALVAKWPRYLPLVPLHLVLFPQPVAWAWWQGIPGALEFLRSRRRSDAAA